MFKILFRLTVFVLLIALLSCQEYADQTYEGYSLYRVYPQNEKHIEKLRSLMTENRDESAIEFWTEPNVYGGPVDIMASPKDQEAIQNRLKIYRIPYKTIMYDVGEVIRRTQRVKTWPSLSYSDTNDTIIRMQGNDYLNAKNFFTEFQRYSMIEEKLKELAKDPRVVLEYPGSTYEGRQMYLVKVSSNPAANKPIIFIDAGHHAREWISHSTLLYILESLINDDMPKYGRGPRWSNLSEDTKNEIETEIENKAKLVRDIKTNLDDYDFWFLPVVNPDGYEHTHTADRLWRKTRSRGTFCSGVDPNRNYPVHWREVGASAFPCDETYAGPHSLSEPETKILAETLSNNQDRIKMYITLHSYSQLLLTPYGHARVYPENWKDLETVALAGVKAIYSLRGTLYRYGPSAVVLYPASGGSDDFAYANTKIKYSYTVELPDTGQHGFLAPPREIIPVGQETSNGIAAMIEAVKNLQ